ncbi:MAG: cytochrome c oxidase accessory protein CcoG [Robiginitomaculum sp.]|nr:MAG: cytochrome c oxidase accessory protein CcoG [Robiginitomaculum sp.]
MTELKIGHDNKPDPNHGQTTRKTVAHGVERSFAKAVSPSTPESLYKKRTQVYPKAVKGTYRSLKWFIMAILLGIYYITPWIRWDRGPSAPNQAVLIDFENARLYFFFIEIWPQEIYYITGLLILSALGLFLATALFGRVWCGYACPQTIWTDLFMAVERFFEGDRNARIKLDKSPWTSKKIAKKTGKHIAWLLISMATGGAWILYFHDAPRLLTDLFIGHAPQTAYVFLALMTFFTYALAGFMREQICTYMCPWPRIQAAMIDDQALNVTYRFDRGEPRGAHKKGETWDGRGDCIGCRQCVAVCPTGIDIRDGAQLECIGCALCIDACDDIMVKIGRPKGLIAYDTDANIERRLKGQRNQFNLIRPRTILYTIAFFGVGAVMVYSLLNRSVLDMNILRDRIPNYVTLSDGSVRNGYTIKILNKATAPRELRIDAMGLDATQMSIVGLKKINGQFILSVPADETLDYKVYLAIKDVSQLSDREIFHLKLTDIKTQENTLTETMFITGNPK